MQVIKTFKGKSRGQSYDYTLTECTKYFTITSFKDGRLVAKMQSYKQPHTVAGYTMTGVDLDTMLDACLEIETRA